MEAVTISAIENWDLYLAAGLACILLSVLIVMQRVTLELNRQRQRRRNNLQHQPPGHAQPGGAVDGAAEPLREPAAAPQAPL